MTLVAYVSARDEAPAGLIEELRDLMRSVPPPMRPARFYLAASIPRLPSSKLDVRALTALDDANVQSERAEPAADAEHALSPAIASRRRSRGSGKTCCSRRFAARRTTSSTRAAIR